MNQNIQNSIFETMKIFSDNAKETSDAALIIECTIQEILNEGIGEYSAEYLGNILTIYASNIDNTYRIDDTVYVAVPEGDFTKTKMIIGYVNPAAVSFSKNEDLGSIYYEISDNLIDKDLGTIDLKSFDESSSQYNLPISNFTSDIFAVIFNDYLESYNTFCLSFSAKTELDIDQQNKGNYGVLLNIPLEVAAIEGSGDTEIVYKQIVLDSTNMLGNYYRFETWTPQSIYFTIDKSQYKLANAPITLSCYCSNFTQDVENNKEPDIHIKDITFNVVQNFVEDNESGTGVTIKASQGVYFSENFKSTKTLAPTLRINGKKTKVSSNKCQVYWFKEDANVINGTDYYNSHGGAGWKCLNKRIDVVVNDDGTTTFNWDSNLLTLELSDKEVPSSARYKCIIIYNNIEASGYITLKNLDTNRKFELKLKNGSLLKDTGYAEIQVITSVDAITDKEQYKNSIFYAWQRYDKENNLIQDNEDFFEITKYNEMIDNSFVTEMHFPVYAIDEINYLYCSPKIVIYKDNKVEEEFLGTKRLTLSTSDSIDYFVDVIGDNLVYKYDSNGNSPMGDAYDGPTTSKVTSIVPLSYRILKPTGEEFIDSEYNFVWYKWIIPKQSMFSISKNIISYDDIDNYYIEGYGKIEIPYSLITRYNISRAKRNISLIVKFQDREISSIANISFLKDGEGGSNGTSYAAVLACGDSNTASAVPYGYLDGNGVAQKLKFLYNTYNASLYYYNTKTYSLTPWSSSARYLYPQVYKDGEQITDFTIEYEMFDSEGCNPCFRPYKMGDNRVRLDRVSTPSISSCNVVQAKITVQTGNNSSMGKSEDIYVYYPIEITVGSFSSIPNIVPSVDGGFSEVMFATDGTNPSWDQTSPFIVKDGRVSSSVFYDEDLGFDDFYNVSWSYSGHLKQNTSREDDPFNAARISPDNKYDDGNAKNYVIAYTNLRSSAVSLINSKISELTSKRSVLSSENTKISNNLVYLRNFASAYKGVEWKNKLNQIQSLLDKQTNGIYNLGLLKEAIEKINYYIDTKKENDIVPSICRSLVDNISSLSTQVGQAIIQIEKLDGTIGYDYDNLISLSNYKIEWNSDIRSAYERALTLDAALNFEVLINDINNQINQYQDSYNNLMTLQSTDYTNIYRTIVTDIQNMCNRIPSSSIVYNRIIDLKNKVLAYVGNFSNCTSYKEINDYIDLMYENVLKSMFRKEEDGSLVINAIAENEFNNNRGINDAEIQKIDDTLICLRGMLNTQGRTFTTLRPIVFYYNRYALSNINGWDGNKLDTGTDREYLLAPQVGAGRKNSDNSFTGIVMGQKNIRDTSQYNQTGLFGYINGVQSMLLNAENGSAIFGRFDHKGSQIIIDPTVQYTTERIDGNTRTDYLGLLYSGNYFTRYDRYTSLPASYDSGNLAYQGMCINLSSGIIHFGELSESGGIIYSGKHKSFIDNKEPGFYLSQKGLSIGEKFQADGTGIVYIGKNAYKGANNTTSKCWIINGAEDSENSYMAYKAKEFGVEFIEEDIPYRSGEKYISGAKFITGAADGQVYIGTDGIRLGKAFAVDATGKMAATGGGVFDGYIKAQGGQFNGPIIVNDREGYISGGKILGSNLYGGQLGLGYIDETGQSVDVTKIDPATIDFNNFTFSVNKNGVVKMTKGSITLNSSKGDTEGENAFHIDSKGNLYVNGTGVTAAKFGIANSGNMYLKGGFIDLCAPLSEDAKGDYEKYTNVFRLAANGNLYIGQEAAWSEKSFQVTNKGKVTIKKGSITLSNKNGDKTFEVTEAGALNMGNNAFKVSTSGDVTITRGSIKIGSNFEVTNDGYMTAVTGAVGSWLINNDGTFKSNNAQNHEIILNAKSGAIGLYGENQSSSILLSAKNGYISLDNDRNSETLPNIVLDAVDRKIILRNRKNTQTTVYNGIELNADDGRIALRSKSSGENNFVYISAGAKTNTVYLSNKDRVDGKGDLVCDKITCGPISSGTIHIDGNKDEHLAATHGWVDDKLEDYATKAYVNQQINSLDIPSTSDIKDIVKGLTFTLDSGSVSGTISAPDGGSCSFNLSVGTGITVRG